MILKPYNLKRGYTLLFAVLMSTLILSLGLSILNISRKEVVLSASSRESQKAFFAADTGIECVAYQMKAAANPAQTFNCNNRQVTMSGSGGVTPTVACTGANEPKAIDAPACSYSFTSSLWLGNGASSVITDPCVNVTVTKSFYDIDNLNPSTSIGNDLSTGARLVTSIESRGYNTCDTNDPRRVERAVRYTY